MITLAKRGDLHARRQALSALAGQVVVHKLFEEVAPRYAERPGGYTRIIKLGPRRATRPRWCSSNSSGEAASAHARRTIFWWRLCSRGAALHEVR